MEIKKASSVIGVRIIAQLASRCLRRGQWWFSVCGNTSAERDEMEDEGKYEKSWM